MAKVYAGDLVKWMEPFDYDYHYGTVVSMDGVTVTVRGTNFYAGKELHVHLKYIRRVKPGEMRAGHGRSQKYH